MKRTQQKGDAMRLLESGQMYLETIFVLSKTNSAVRAIDVGEYMGFSKPSVSRALGLLREGGYVTVDTDGHLTLTEAGREVAEKIYERQKMPARLNTTLAIFPLKLSSDICKNEKTAAM